MSYFRQIDSVVEVLGSISEMGVKCNLLIGAGCSVTAGIPTADGILEVIKNKYNSIYQIAPKKDYATCMSKLTSGERRGLIKNLVSGAHLNMTHIAIAQLLHEGFIHRILTPNFDNLLIRACSLVNEFPPIYDLASNEDFKPEYLPDKCIFYLHGQYTGLKLMNTQQEVELQAKRLKPLFNRLHENSVWLVIGYSGLNDGLFTLLSQVPEFEHRLFWIGHKDEQPHSALTEKLLSDRKYAFYINGYDSDSFFWELSMRLGKFPPKFITKPFTYLKSLIDELVPYKPDGYSPPNQVMGDVITQAINKFEKKKSFMADYYYKLGLHENILEWENDLLKQKKHELLSHTYFAKAYKIASEATRLESEVLAREALNCYQKSVQLNDNFSGTHNNMGVCWRDIWLYGDDKNINYLFSSIEEYIVSIRMDSKRFHPWSNFFKVASDLLKRFDISQKILNDLTEQADILFNSISDADLKQEVILDWIIKVEHALDKRNTKHKDDIERFLNCLGELKDILVEAFVEQPVAAATEN